MDSSHQVMAIGADVDVRHLVAGLMHRKVATHLFTPFNAAQTHERVGHLAGKTSKAMQ